MLLVAVNMRAAVTSVGPVLEDIRADLGLTAAEASALTALPVLCFGLAAAFAPPLSRRLGIERSLALVLAATTVGLALRVSSSTAALFAGTLLAGAAIAVGNVLIPALIKRDFPERSGPMMGLYVSVMAASAAVAAAVTVPVGDLTGWDWRGGLGIWMLPAAVALVPWVVRVRRSNAEGVRPVTLSAALRRDVLAWQVTLFMGLQSLGFYALVAWLPAIYRSRGVSADQAGFLLSMALIVGVPFALIVPSLATRGAQQRGWTTATTGITGLGLLGLLVAPTAYPAVWPLLLGMGTGSAFPLGLTLVVLRSRNVIDAARLSAMSQSAGYLLASAGPFAFGALRDVTGGWDASIVLLLLLLIPQLLSGWGAGRAAHVGGD
ncbi:MAG: MFS transporter [Nitriliruptorales bacterium]|nr:MFS transporter [Nitriliruptorales bacterium]